MGLVRPIKEFGVAIIGVSKQGNHTAKQISPQKEYYGDAFVIEIFSDYFMVFHQPLKLVGTSVIESNIKVSKNKVL